MFDSKKIFYIVFSFVIVVEIVVLGIVLGSYFSNSNKVIENTQNQRKIISIIYRDTNIEYLKKKFSLIIEDAFLIMKTYDNVVKWGINNLVNKSEKINKEQNFTVYNYTYEDEKIIPGYLMNESDYKKSWYIEKDPQKRLEGFYIYNRNETFNDTTQFQLNNTLVTQKIITNLFKKYFQWKDKIYVNVEFIYLSFSSTGFFYKYPLVYSNSAYAEYESAACLDGKKNITKIKGYDPRCRPFFIKANNSSLRITITEPYKFQSGIYGNDICIKSKKENINDYYDFEYLLCYAFSFYDYYIFKSQISQILNKTETQIYLVYVEKEKDKIIKIKVVFNSEYYPNELTCVEAASEKYSCEPIDFFNVLYKKILDELAASLNQSQNDQEKVEQYLKNYEILQTYYNESVYEQIKKIIGVDPQELLQINLDNVNEAKYDSNFFFSIPEIEIGNINTNNNITITNTAYTKTFYLFPLIGGFNYSVIDEGYKLIENNDTQNFNYYIITVEGGRVINNSTTNFKVVVVIEICLFFIYLFFLDTLIWVVFCIFYYYFYHGILLPLKKMVKLYLNIGKITAISESKTSSEIKINKAFNSFQILKSFTIPTQTNQKKKETKVKSCLSRISNFKGWLSDIIDDIFRMSDYKDISDALTSLQAINLILQFNDTELTGVHIQRTESFSKMANFTDAIEYLMERFYSGEKNVEDLQFPMIKLIIEKMFIAVLKDKNNSINSIEGFYNKITTAVRRTKAEMKVSMRDKKNFENKEEIDNSMEILKKLENNLLYYFYTFKALKIEGDRNQNEEQEENFILSKYNPDEEENRCLNILKKNEESYLRNPNKKWNKKINENDFGTNSKTLQIAQGNIFLNDYLEEGEEIKILRLTETLEQYLTANSVTTILSRSDCDQSDFESNFVNTLDEKKIMRNRRIAKMIKLLKNISVKCILSRLYILTSENQRGLAIYEEIFSTLKQFEKFVLVESNVYKNTPRNGGSIFGKDKEALISLSKWKFTSFALLTCEVLFFEKILYLLTLIQKKYGQIKNELFIFLNILDLGPIYTVPIKKSIINKLTLFVKSDQKKKLYSCGLENNDFSLATTTNLLQTNNDYIDIQRALYKLITLRNVTIKTTKKKILFVFDLDNKFLKDKIFKEILLHHFQKNNKLNEYSFHYTYFTKKLHILTNTNFKDIEINDTKFVKNYLKNIPLGEMEQVFCGEDESEKRTKILADFFFNVMSKEFIQKNRKRASIIRKPKEVYRADKALYHAAVFGIENEIKNLNNLTTSPSTYNKYLIMFVNINSIFTDNKKNWEEIAKIVYEEKFTLIIIISTNNDEISEDINKKISNYKKCINNYVIDGHLFLMKNFEMLKIILNSIFPIRFSEFNTNIIYHFLESIKLIYNSSAD